MEENRDFLKRDLVFHPSGYIDQTFRLDSYKLPGTHLINVEELPLSNTTRIWHDDWFKTFQVNCDKKRRIPNFPSPEAYEAFDNEGIELWKEIRKELAPYYNVFYYNTCLKGVFKQPDAPMVKRIRLMRDWFCPMTWFVDDVGCFDPSELPASQETIA